MAEAREAWPEQPVPAVLLGGLGKLQAPAGRRPSASYAFGPHGSQWSCLRTGSRPV